MIDFENLKMYLKYAEKVIYLNLLKKFAGLDFAGRIETSDKKFNGYEGCYPVKKILYQFPFKRKIFEKYGFKAVYEKFPNLLLEI